MKAAELMTRDAKTCLADEDMNRAAQIMWEADCGIVPVVDESRRVVGMITDRDLCMASYTMGGPLVSLRVGDAMAKEVFSCSPEENLESAMATMRRARVHRLPVVDELGKLVGILSLNDVAREAVRQRQAGGRQQPALDLAETLAAICEPRRACPVEERPAPKAKTVAAVAVLTG